ncbi:olfactory receptor 7G2-like [Pteropus alecto]|uniref:olfactory receptor 7G2-like n=1 Tax=Pteropus alecto TaxID=9402 RepID=UPI000768735C|nr:olfactory receptor 7G2-like [Pteropus alecto]
MEPRNLIDVSEFLLLELTDDLELQPHLFYLFLTMYLATVLRSLLIILAISSDSHLHTPMYFFPHNLSFIGICLSTVTITFPEVLVNIQAQDQSTTFIGCLTQIGLVVVLSGFENFLLAAMASDCYMAICHPLRYMVIMNPHLCVLLAILSLFLSSVVALLHSLMVLRCPSARLWSYLETNFHLIPW